MHRHLIAALLMWSAAVLTSCAPESVSGHASATMLPVGDLPAYSANLDAGDQTYIRNAAAIRRLDPCGYLDLEVLRQLGMPRDLDAASSQDSCYLDVNVERDRAKALSIQVQLTESTTRHGWSTSEIDVDGNALFESRHIDTEESYFSSGFNSCDHFIPFAAGYDLWISVTRSNMPSVCTETRIISAAAISHFNDKPLRETSRHGAFHAVSVADPCEGAALLAGDEPIDVNVEWSSTFRCTFSVGSGVSWRTVKVFSTSVRPSDYPDTERIKIDGRAAERTSTRHGCKVLIKFDDPQHGSAYDPVENTLSRSTNAVEVSADTCGIAEETARAAVAAFLDEDAA